MNADTKIQLNGIDHFALNVKDMNRAEHFYSDLLGFEVVTRTSTKAGLKHIELDAGNVFIALFESPELDLENAQKTMTDDGYLHFAFAADKDQAPEIIQSLKDNGVRFDGETRNHPGGDSVYFYDPDGHVIEIHVQRD
jgi:catechol 2,3-dioxygenase-like lactoylglutathione lyase family enzyme